MSEVILSIEELSAGYGDFSAVNSVSMKIEKGSTVALMGLNGAGKTTLMNTVSGLHKPDSGRVVFKGEEISSLPPGRIVSRGLSLVPQGGRCFNRMSVHDNLMMGSFPRASRKSAARNIEAVYELFPALKEMKKRPAGELSGGQRQMVAIGRALMSEPECLIFDEISLGLAPAVIKDIYQRIAKINRERGTTVILIEQDTGRALGASDSFFVMLKGRVVLSGKPSEVDPETLKKAYFGI